MACQGFRAVSRIVPPATATLCLAISFLYDLFIFPFFFFFFFCPVLTTLAAFASTESVRWWCFFQQVSWHFELLPLPLSFFVLPPLRGSVVRSISRFLLRLGNAFLPQMLGHRFHGFLPSTFSPPLTYLQQFVTPIADTARSPSSLSPLLCQIV